MCVLHSVIVRIFSSVLNREIGRGAGAVERDVPERVVSLAILALDAFFFQRSTRHEELREGGVWVGSLTVITCKSGDPVINGSDACDLRAHERDRCRPMSCTIVATMTSTASSLSPGRRFQLDYLSSCSSSDANL